VKKIGRERERERERDRERERASELHIITKQFILIIDIYNHFIPHF
jgi:hypothetical protein